MKNKIIVFFIMLVLLFVSYANKQESPESKTDTVADNTKVTPEKKSMTVNLLLDEEIVKLDLEEYIVGVVACEMPASFNNEALKAMSVAARTYAMYKMNGKKTYDLKSTTEDQCYNTIEAMKKKWGNSYDKYYNKIKKAVESTSDKYMTYKGDVIIAFYFSISNGYTENCENVFSQKLDYLVSVDSNWDSEYSYKEAEKEYKLDDFFDKLNMKDTKIKNIDIERTKSGRVNTIKVNDKKFKGTNFRTLLSLKSTDFEITYDNSKVYINTKGYGHGVGMSQYGANAMANKGYKYDEILKYYYTGVKIVNN